MSLFLGAPCLFSSLLLPSEFGGRRHKTVLVQSDDDPIKPAQSDFNSPHPWYVFPAVNCRSLPFTPSALFMRIMRRSSLPVDISSGPWERQPLPAALWGAAGFRSPTCVLFSSHAQVAVLLSFGPPRFLLCHHRHDLRQQHLNVCTILLFHGKPPWCSLFSYIRGAFVTVRFYRTCSFRGPSSQPTRSQGS